MPTDEQLLDEAYKRNLLPQDLRGVYEEAKKRGIVGAASDPERNLPAQIASGIKDVAVKGTQFAEHTMGKERFDQVNKWLETQLGPELGENFKDVPGNQGEDYDAYVARREKVLEGRYGEGFNASRTAGNMLALAPLTPARLLAAAASRPILGGAGIGAIGGAAQPVTNGGENFWGTTAEQTGLGAAGGAVLGGVGKAAGATIDYAGRKLAEKFTLPNIIDPKTGKMIDLSKITDPRARKRMQTAITNTLAKEQIGQRIASDKSGGGLSQAELLGLVRRANEYGIPMTMADFADPELQGLIGNLTRVPGPARTRIRKFLEKRDIDEGKYLVNMVRRMLTGGKNDTAYRTAETLISQQAKNSAPLYEKVAEHPGVMSPKLRIMLNTNALKGALKPGIEFETNMAASEGKEFDPIALGLIADEEGNFAMPAAPQLRVLDIAKKGLDAMIGAERDANGRLSQRGLGLDRLRRAFIKEIDELDTTGVYKAARDAWAGPAASLDAIELGQKVFKNHPEEFADLMGDMSEANKDFVRIGAADSMIEKILEVGLHGDEAKALVRSPYVRMRLEPLFKSKAGYNHFMEEIDYAVRRFETRRKLTGGSPTGERIAEDQSGKITKMSVAAQVLKELASGHPIGALNAVRHIYKYWRDVGFEPDEALNDAIAKIVTTVDKPGKRHTIPQRFNLKRLENPLRSVSPVVRQLITQIGAGATGLNVPQ